MKLNTPTPSVALLFAGQGNPVIGMGADLWGIHPEAKKIWDCASDISGMDIRRLCQKGPMSRLIQTTVQQIAVTAINVTLFSLYRERFGDAHIVASCGHSVGEYSALYAAGALSLESLFSLIHFRANVMNDVSKRNKGAMLAVKGVDYSQMNNLISHSGLQINISCDNTHNQQVIGGTPDALNDFTRVLRDAGFDPVKLGVSGAWHTDLMVEGVALMHDFLAGIEIARPVHAVLMNVTGKPEFSPIRIKENLAQHLTETVRWADSMECLLSLSPSTKFVEMSNKAYLAHMLNDFSGFSPAMAMHCRNLLSR